MLVSEFLSEFYGLFFYRRHTALFAPAVWHSKRIAASSGVVPLCEWADREQVLSSENTAVRGRVAEWYKAPGFESGVVGRLPEVRVLSLPPSIFNWYLRLTWTDLL